MSLYPMTKVALDSEGRGYVITVTEPLDGYHSGTVLATGSVLRVSGDGRPDEWKAWLWPEAGGALHVAQSCQAETAASPAQLQEKLRKRVAKHGPWWEVR